MDAPEALREFLSYAVANLIDHPQQASIAIGHNAAGATTFRIQLAQEDVKRVIGKHGHTISAIRSLLNVAAAKHGIKVSLKVGTAKEDDAEAEAEATAANESGAKAESPAAE
ncbi:MAG: KH domain-containing protein [Verrucomicrobiaceae bacterium]|nr:KH domain-containing protein [Verrucomicrobiaceae bacterium]